MGPHNTRVTDRILYVSDDVSELGKRSYANRNKKKEKDRHSKKKGCSYEVTLFVLSDDDNLRLPSLLSPNQLYELGLWVSLRA